MQIIPNLSVILACDDAGGIGKNNELFCHIPEDLQWFKKHTLHKKVIMGTNTFKSIEAYTKGKLLPNREHWVLSKNGDFSQYAPSLVSHYREVDDILNAAQLEPQQEFMVIGGAQVYNLFLPYTNQLYLTRVAGEFDCDTFVDLSLYNKNLSNTHHTLVPKSAKSEFDYHFMTYQLEAWEPTQTPEATLGTKVKI